MERHPMDPVSLAFGLAFAVAGVALSTMELGFSDLQPGRWWPVPVLFLGLLLLLVALNRTREGDERTLLREGEDDSEPAENDPRVP